MKMPRRFAWMACSLMVLGLMALSTPRPVLAANAPDADLPGFSERLSAVADQCRAATVGIVIPGGSMGSGVIINEEGLVLTAAHVLPEDGKTIVITLSDGRQVAAESLGINRKIDSGMARITEPGKYPFAPIAEADTMWEGDWCIAFGNGGGVQTDRPAPMRLGRILHISSSTSPIRWITTDSTVISGDSGGPLFDLQGKVIGIHSNIGMSVLVNRHVPISSYHAQWDKLSEPGEFSDLPQAPEPVVPGLAKLPGGIEREIARRLSDGDDELRQALEKHRNAASGIITLSPEDAAAMLGREDVLEEILAYRDKIQAREQRTNQIENAGNEDEDKPESEVSRRSTETRKMILKALRERALDNIADDLRRTHGKIAEHVLSRFEPSVSAAGPVTVEVLCRGNVVALGTVVRQDGYIVTKASELAGPARVRINGEEYRAMVVNGNGPNDLALLKINVQDLTPVQWADQSPALGSLLVVPNPAGKPLAMGVVGVDARTIPQSVNNVFIAPPQPPYLGVAELKSPDEGEGVLVGSVPKDAPAARAGVKAGDLITAVNGDAIADVKALIDLVKQAKAGDKVTLTIQRDQETLELTVELAERPAPPRRPKGDDSQSAAQVYSARGGKLSERRTNFPLALTHDAVIWAPDIGGPVLNLDGKAIGLNIARYGRTATYALPAEHAKTAIEQMMRGK